MSCNANFLTGGPGSSAGSSNFLDLRSVLRNIREQQLGPIGKITFTEIELLNYFVIEDVLASNQIPDVTFDCYILNNPTLRDGPLSFHGRAFKSVELEGEESSLCTVINTLTFTRCNLREFNPRILSNCPLKTLRFQDCHIEGIPSTTSVTSLATLSIGNQLNWTPLFNELPAGIRDIEFSNGPFPNLRTLNLNGNSLTDKQVRNLQNSTFLEEVFLKGSNDFSNVPDLTGLYNLKTFEIDVNKLGPERLSILLPNPRAPLTLLNATISSNVSQTTIDVLTGDLKNVDLRLDFDLTLFEERVFKTALENMYFGYLYLINGGNL